MQLARLRAGNAAPSNREHVRRLRPRQRTRSAVLQRLRPRAHGDAVNVAARLEQAARADEILLGEETRGLIGDRVRVERLEPLTVKGKAAPLSAWRVVELLPDSPAFMRSTGAPFIGRAQELEVMRDAFERTVREQSCTVVTVIGPPESASRDSRESSSKHSVVRGVTPRRSSNLSRRKRRARPRTSASSRYGA